MKNLNNLSKVFLFICFLSGILWLGSYIARITLAYQLFQGNDFALNSYITNQNLSGIFITLNAGIILESTLYIAFIITLIFFIIFSKINLKNNGWLLIVLLIVFVTLPFEIYLKTIDYKIIMTMNAGVFSNSDILQLYIRRFKVLGSFPIVETLSYFAVLYFILFKPFKAKSEILNEN